MENNLEEKSIKSAKFKKRLKIAVIIAITLVAFFVIWVLTLDTPKGSQDMGFSGYTQEELNKMFPQIKNADIPTRITPEQTYAALKEALKNEDVDAAAECFAETMRGEYKNILLAAEEDKNLNKLGEALPEKIIEVYTYELISQYKAPQIVDGENTSHTFDFIKDRNGDWKIKSL